jgi:hypothetical protein
MASRGIILKSCLCSTDGRPGRRRNRTCPRLGERGHGSWQFDCRVKDIRGRSTQVRRGGFPSQAAATRARDDVLDQSLERFTGQHWTVERWLRYWLTTSTSIRPTTLRVYTQHIEQYLIPQLGKPCTASVPPCAARSTPPSANDLITDNPARRVELPSRPRPHAVVWTPERVEQWQRHGVRDKVAVWTAEHLATSSSPCAPQRRPLGARVFGSVPQCGERRQFGR